MYHSMMTWLLLSVVCRLPPTEAQLFGPVAGNNDILGSILGLFTSAADSASNLVGQAANSAGSLLNNVNVDNNLLNSGANSLLEGTQNSFNQLLVTPVEAMPAATNVIKSVLSEAETFANGATRGVSQPLKEAFDNLAPMNGLVNGFDQTLAQFNLPGVGPDVRSLTDQWSSLIENLFDMGFGELMSGFQLPQLPQLNTLFGK